MPYDPKTPRRGPSDATDYSSTKAPETRAEAEEQNPHPGDHRLHPGGATGTAADPGMSSLDRRMLPGEDEGTDPTRPGE